MKFRFLRCGECIRGRDVVCWGGVIRSRSGATSSGDLREWDVWALWRAAAFRMCGGTEGRGSEIRIRRATPFRRRL